MIWVALISVVVMLGAAVAVLILPSYLGAVAASSVVSLALSVLFVVLRAPDVALEGLRVTVGTTAALAAAVGSGVASLLPFRRALTTRTRLTHKMITIPTSQLRASAVLILLDRYPMSSPTAAAMPPKM